MTKRDTDKLFENLPQCAADYIRYVIKKMRYRKKIRAEVRNELIAHFEDALCDGRGAEEKEKIAKELIAEFGNAKMLGKLARRAKKRCRPLWRKAIIRTIQASGIVILYIALCIGYLAIGKPAVSENYCENWLNDYVRAGRDNSINAQPFYEKAGIIAKKMPEPDWLSNTRISWPSDFNDYETTALASWLDENTEAFELLQQGSAKAGYWNIYETNDPNMNGFLGSIRKPLRGYRHLAQNARWKIKYDAYRNNFSSAFANATALLKFGHNMQGQGTLVEQLVGIAIEAMAIQATLESIYRKDFSQENLKELQALLEQFAGEAVIDIRGEKGFVYDFVQQSFTDDGKALLKAVPLSGETVTEIIFNVLTFNMPDKEDVLERINSHYEINQRLFERTPCDLKNTPNAKPVRAGFLYQKFNSAYDRLVELSWHVKTDRNALISVIAVLRYHRQMGRYPDSLEGLLNGGFITKIPFDAYRNGSLTYRKTDDAFILYSFGQDCDDDGGTPSSWGKLPEGGDQVFWPIKK